MSVYGVRLRRSRQGAAHRYVKLTQFAAQSSMQSLARAGGSYVWPDTNLNKYSKTLDGFVPEMHMWEGERLF